MHGTLIELHTLGPKPPTVRLRPLSLKNHGGDNQREYLLVLKVDDTSVLLQSWKCVSISSSIILFFVCCLSAKARRQQVKLSISLSMSAKNNKWKRVVSYQLCSSNTDSASCAAIDAIARQDEPRKSTCRSSWHTSHH